MVSTHPKGGGSTRDTRVSLINVDMVSWLIMCCWIYLALDDTLAGDMDRATWQVMWPVPRQHLWWRHVFIGITSSIFLVTPRAITVLLRAYPYGLTLEDIGFILVWTLIPCIQSAGLHS